MVEIQRWLPTTGTGMIPAESAAGFVTDTDHTAALEAQAEEHEKEVRLLRSQQSCALGLEINRVEFLKAEVGRLNSQHAQELKAQDKSWRETLQHEKWQHAQELAEARGEGEPALKLLRRVHRRISFTLNDCSHICARCREVWPCETAVIAGLG